MRDTRTDGANRHLADNLRALRERKGISQPALAEAMKERGIAWHQQTVGRIEAGQQRVKWDEAVALSAILGVPLDRFTWPPAEANAADALYMAAERLRRQATDLTNAVGALLSATRLADRAVKDTAEYVSPRVDDAREILADALKAYDLVSVVNEGVLQDAERYGDDSEGGDDGAEMPQPGLAALTALNRLIVARQAVTPGKGGHVSSTASGVRPRANRRRRDCPAMGDSLP